jgi:hypothetical protein
VSLEDFSVRTRPKDWGPGSNLVVSVACCSVRAVGAITAVSSVGVNSAAAFHEISNKKLLGSRFCGIFCRY